jgi:hypothetical protein
MPCRDFYDDHPEAYFKDVTEPALKKKISFAESALCSYMGAALRQFMVLNTTATLDEGMEAVLDLIDHKDAGIKKEDLRSWWKKHRALDEEHRKEMAEKKRTAELIKSARAKLSSEELKALGVKVK